MTLPESLNVFEHCCSRLLKEVCEREKHCSGMLGTLARGLVPLPSCVALGKPLFLSESVIYCSRQSAPKLRGLKQQLSYILLINLQFGQGSVERALLEFYVTKAEAAQTEAAG